MKQIKKLLALALIGIMVLAACANPDADTPDPDMPDPGTGSGTAATPEPPPTVSDDGREMRGNMFLEGLPIGQERESFTILIDDGADISYIDEWPFVVLMEEDTNIHVDWMVFPHEVAQERKNILLNTGEYPDVIGGWLINRDEIIRYGAGEGIFIPLQGLFEQYAPNIMDALNLPGVRTDMTLPNGNIYSPPYPWTNQEVLNGPWIYQPWLDALNLQMPTSMDELTNVLRAFRDRDPNGDGSEIVPFGVRGDQLGLAMAFFGYPVVETPDRQFIMVDGRPTFTATMDFYKDAIEHFAGWFAEGLMDPEIFTDDIEMMRGKGRGSEHAFYGLLVSHDPGDVSPGHDDNGMPLRVSEYVPLPPLTNPLGTTPQWARATYGFWLFTNQLVITDNAKNPEMIVRWLDYLYSHEISAQALWGVFGIEQEEIAPNVFQLFEEEDNKLADNHQRWIGAMPKFPRPEFELIRSASAMVGHQAIMDMDEVWGNNLVEMTPQAWLTSEQASEIATIRTDIENYIRIKRAEWISGASNVRDDWDDYLAQLDRMGLQTLTDVVLGSIGY